MYALALLGWSLLIIDLISLIFLELFVALFVLVSAICQSDDGVQLLQQVLDALGDVLDENSLDAEMLCKAAGTSVVDLSVELIVGFVFSILGQVMVLVSFVTLWECHVLFAK